MFLTAKSNEYLPEQRLSPFQFYADMRHNNPTQIAEHLNFILPVVSTSLRILKEADLITEIKKGKNRFYPLNRKMTSELVRFFDDMYIII
jgi:DNA-binding transcriptional ArsR family regulator